MLLCGMKPIASLKHIVKGHKSRWTRSLITSSHINNPPEFRDVFVIDPSFQLKEWLLLPENRPSSGYRGIIHPSCKHAIAGYGQYFYSNVKYNYNDLGEFSLNIIATEFLTKHTSHGSSVEVPSTHSLLLWPEGVFVEGLQRSDIPTMGDYLLNKNSSTADLSKLKLSNTCKISPLSSSRIIALSQISSTQTAQQALQTIQHLTTASADFPRMKQLLEYGIGVQLNARHRSGANVLILAGSAQLAGSDSFESVWSVAQAKKILSSYETS